jgi:hypothetical protein
MSGRVCPKVLRASWMRIASSVLAVNHLYFKRSLAEGMLEAMRTQDLCLADFQLTGIALLT